MAERLSLIAGSGALAREVMEAARGQGYQLQVLAVGGRSRLWGMPTTPFDLADPEAAIRAISAFGSTCIAMAGGVRLSDTARERLVRLAGAPGAVSVGDTVLSALAATLTRLTGARVLGVLEIAPELVAGEGRLGGPEPTDRQSDAAKYALTLAREAGALDLGQAVVVAGRRAIAVEDIAGTDALLMRVRQYRRLGFAADGASALVFAKAAKPKQPLFVDLPAIGPVTVANARKAGIELIAVQAGATLLIERAKLVAAADAARIAILGIAVPDA